MYFRNIYSSQAANPCLKLVLLLWILKSCLSCLHLTYSQGILSLPKTLVIYCQISCNTLVASHLTPVSHSTIRRSVMSQSMGKTAAPFFNTGKTTAVVSRLVRVLCEDSFLYLRLKTVQRACSTWFDQDMVRPHFGDMVQPQNVIKTWFDSRKMSLRKCVISLEHESC